MNELCAALKIAIPPKEKESVSVSEEEGKSALTPFNFRVNTIIFNKTQNSYCE